MEFILQNQVFFIFVLAFVTFGLSLYLGLIVKRIKEQPAGPQSLLDEETQKIQERADYFKESILIIAKSALAQDCEAAEACIRIYKLIQNFPDIAKEEEFIVLDKMFQELDELSILGQRKELTKAELKKEDKQRFEIEKKYHGPFQDMLTPLISRFEI